MSYQSELTVCVSPGQIYLSSPHGGIAISMVDVRVLRDHLTHIIQRIDDEAKAAERFENEDREAVTQ